MSDSPGERFLSWKYLNDKDGSRQSASSRSATCQLCGLYSALLICAMGSINPTKPTALGHSKKAGGPPMRRHCLQSKHLVSVDGDRE